MATCFLRTLHRSSLQAPLYVAGRRKLSGLLEGHPAVSRFIPLDSDSIGEAIRLGFQWRDEFSCGFILPNSFRSALFPWLARARKRIGYGGQGRELLLTDNVRFPKSEGRRRLPEPMPRYWRRLADKAGITWNGDRPELFVTAGERGEIERKAARLGVGEHEKVVGLSPGAAFGPSKLWIPERFGEVAAALYRELGLRSALLLAPGEEELGRAIVDSSSSPIISTAGDPLSLALLKAFMDRCALVVSADSGTRHIAVARGIPVVTVMGPTDPRYSAYCLEKQAVVRKEVPCGPCHLKSCPLDHRCMREITAQEVLKEALQLLNRDGCR